MADTGFCLVSQEIRELIRQGSLKVPDFDEARVQPASFDPRIGDEIFILDTEPSLFRPRQNQTVYRALLEVPKQRRRKEDISGGFEIKKG